MSSQGSVIVVVNVPVVVVWVVEMVVVNVFVEQTAHCTSLPETPCESLAAI